MLTFRLGKCCACGRTKPLKGTKNKRCYDCTLSGFTKKSKNIPWKQVESNDETGV